MTEFFSLTIIGLLMIISPGPDFALVTKLSLSDGRLNGIGAAMGIALANLCHVILNVCGIGLIIATSPILFSVLKFFSAGYLLYIGYKGLRAKPTITSSSSEASMSAALENQSLSKGIYSGFITSLLNPKAWLFYLSFFSVLISPNTKIFTQFLYGTWLSVLALCWFIIVAFFFTNKIFSQKLKSLKHWIERVAGGALILFGLRLLSAKTIF